MKEGTKVCLGVWHSGAFKYIVFTACAVVLLAVIRKMLKEFVDCKKNCELPKSVENIATKATNALIGNTFNRELNKMQRSSN